VKRVLAEILVVLLQMGGFGLLTYGAWLAWRPAGFIVPGTIMLALGLFAEHNS
jgi:hypothetical protein